ncbi:hypothetical protein DPX39_110111300 [Trypanosoma brucei equiperdum]|uniref:Uncharacterized protein n=1 Tax=Trypanosoma brucei equiperdum TaxID=630700 RepID=A0A3L6KU88_9TRYP|nr:hypothetical protein DPX39_110111300 [Trypanosoma brucei equiperdum]
MESYRTSAKLAELDESGCTEMPEIELGFSTEVLRAVADYLEKSSRFVIDARRPLTGSLRDFVPEWNLDFVRGAERREILMPLFECACFLCVVELRELLGAYVAERVNEIAREAPSIMGELQGCAHIFSWRTSGQKKKLNTLNRRCGMRNKLTRSHTNMAASPSPFPSACITNWSTNRALFP